MTSARHQEPAAGTADEARRLREEIEQTRQHLGDTVEQLAAKVDVKSRARAEAAQLTGRVKVAVTRARGQAMLTAARARGARHQAQRSIAAAGEAGQERVRLGAAQARQAAPAAARQALDKGASTARAQRLPVAAGAGALLAALAVLLFWQRRKK